MNVLTAREDIDDNEFYWCENAIPVAAGALYPVSTPTNLTTVSGEFGAPSYTMTFNANGIDYSFSVWSTTGNGWVTNLSGAGFPPYQSTKIITGLTSGQTSATQYSNQGVLIIDPTGYWDWNITAPLTLTIQNNAVAGTTLVNATSVAGGTPLQQVLSV